MSVLVMGASLVSADGPAPDRPTPLVVEPYWTADLPASGKSMAVTDFNGDGQSEIVVAMSNGQMAAWDAFGNSMAAPSNMPVVGPAASRYTFDATITAGKDVVTATLTATEGNHLAAQFTRRMQDKRGFEFWPANDGNSLLVGDDEGLTWWRLDGQSLRFATRGRPSFAWSGRLRADGPVIVAALVGKQLEVFGASSDKIREGVLWRVPRPANDVQTSQEEEDAQPLDKTDRKWWTFGSGNTVHLIRDDGQVIRVQAPGPVTHVSLSDLEGNGTGQIIVSLDDGRVVAMAADGQILWQLPPGPPVVRLSARDLARRVLILDESPALRLYKSDGQAIARLELPFAPVRHLVTDINDDGRPEIVVATSGVDENGQSGAVVVADMNGNPIWQREQGPADWIAPLRSGGKMRALTSDNGDDGLIAYSPSGQILWQYKATGGVYYDAVDLLGNGEDGVLLSSKVRGPMVALDGDGKEAWRFEPAPNVFMNTNWVVTDTHGVRNLYESWYTIGPGDNPDQSYVSRLDTATGQEVWRLHVPQTVYVVQGADTDGDGQAEVWAFTWPGVYRLDPDTGTYLQVSEAKWSNSGYFRVVKLYGSGLDQVVFFDPNGVEAHGLVAEQPPLMGALRAESSQAGVNISLSNLLDPGKSSALSVTLAISLPLTGQWDAVSLAARDEKSGRLLWTTTAFGPWDAGQQRVYRLGVSDGVYTATLTGALAIPAYDPPLVVPLEGERYSYRLPLNAARIVTTTLEVLRPGSQTWETLAAKLVPPGSSGEWDVAPFGVWDSDKPAQARFIVDDGVRSGVFATFVGPQVQARSDLNVEVSASDYRLSGQLRDPHAVTLTIELFDPVVGWSLLNKGDWLKTATVIVPAGGGAFAAEVRSFYDAFDIGHDSRYRVWADDGTRRDIWIEGALSPIAGFPWWAYVIVFGLITGAGASGGVAIVRQRQAQRLADDMRVARAIQESLMPESMPSIPGLDIVGGSMPALEVGGDFFGYYRRRDHALGVAVGDVSGKGLPAALLMAVSVGLLAAEASRTTEPSDVLDHIDDVLKSYTRRNRLNTALCYVVISSAENGFSAHVVNAGGISPLVRRADGKIEWLDAHGLPLGVLDAGEANRPAVRTDLRRGDVLILTSDGILEAMDFQRRIFGFERFEQAVTQARAELGAVSVRDSILAAMHAFGMSVPPHDDVTLVVIRVE